MKTNGYAGGTPTGWVRGKQIATGKTLSEQDLQIMRAWFARHRYTSYPGYQKWVKANRPTSAPINSKLRNSYRGAVAWLLWGGDAAYASIGKSCSPTKTGNKTVKKKQNTLG